MSTGGPQGLLHLAPSTALHCLLLRIPSTGIQMRQLSCASRTRPPCDRVLAPFLEDSCLTLLPTSKIHSSNLPGLQIPCPPLHYQTLWGSAYCFLLSPPALSRALSETSIQPGASCVPHPPHLLFHILFSALQAVAFTSSLLLFPGYLQGHKLSRGSQ